VKRTSVDPSRARTAVGEAVDATDLAAVRYRLAPGEGFPSGLHAHYDQEEVFVVLAGEAVFEVLPPEESWDGDAPTGREVTVAASEAVRFAPGEFQTGRNPVDADEDVVALALGAPRDTVDVRIPAACPRADCDAPALALGTGGDAFTLDCPDCEASFQPMPCPDCGSDDLAMHLDEHAHPVSRCEDCGREHAQPPVGA
jgi:mannose-6-phosphate isomerase-like protein (cupin superfamily)